MQKDGQVEWHNYADGCKGVVGESLALPGRLVDDEVDMLAIAEIVDE